MTQAVEFLNSCVNVAALMILGLLLAACVVFLIMGDDEPDGDA